MPDGIKILMIKNMVVITINVVVISVVSTTTYCVVVEKLTTGKIVWSLIVLTMELLTTMDDHTFVVVNF